MADLELVERLRASPHPTPSELPPDPDELMHSSKPSHNPRCINRRYRSQHDAGPSVMTIGSVFPVGKYTAPVSSLSRVTCMAMLGTYACSVAGRSCTHAHTH